MIKIRIRPVGDKFISEYAEKTFFGKIKWLPFDTYLGFDDKAFPFSSEDACLNSALLKLKWDILRNSR